MAEKSLHGGSTAGIAGAIFIGAFVNAVFSFLGLIICMPCMLSDALGGYALVYTYKRSGGGRGKLTRRQGMLFGAFCGLLGSAFFLFVLFLVYLAFGNLMEMASGLELFGNSISGIKNIPGWAVLVAGALIIGYKILVSAIAVSILSSME